MAGLGLMLGGGSLWPGAGTAPPVDPPAAPATLPLAPDLRWHPAFSTVIEDGEGRLVSASDLMGRAGVVAGAESLGGPKVLTDRLGRRFWRFEGSEYLTISPDVTFASSRAISVFHVGRGAGRLLCIGSRDAGTAANGGQVFEIRAQSHEVPFIGSARLAPPGAGKEDMVAGSQLMVAGGINRTTANGGNISFLNRKSCVVGNQLNSATDCAGGEIGRYAWATGAAGSWMLGDFYEMVVYNRSLTQAEGEAVMAALADHYGIAEIEHQLVLEGDSISQGTGNATGHNSPPWILSEPGAGHVPANWRVVGQATSGSKIANLLTRRDNANSWSAQLLPGQNVMAFEIGRNDMGGGAPDPALHHANVTAWLTTPETGVLPRGWTVRQLVNIAGSSALMAGGILPYRAMILDPLYLEELGAGAGQPLEGRFSTISTHLIEQAGKTLFLTASDALDPVHYAGDSTHPTYLGQIARLLGGDTPHYGLVWGLE